MAGVYHWGGKQASRLCRAKAMEVAHALKKQRQDKPRTFSIDEEPQKISELLTKYTVKIDAPDLKEPGFDTKVFEVLPKAEEDAGISKTVKLIHYGFRPSKSILSTNRCYIVEAQNEVFVWNGKHANKTQKSLTSYIAHELLKKKRADSPAYLFFESIDEQLETAIFKVRYKIHPKSTTHQTG